MEINKWTKKEEQYLLDNYKLLSNKEISENINKDVQSIRSKKCQLRKKGYDIGLGCVEWNLEEIEILKKNYLTMSNNELAKLINKTSSAIQAKISKLGLERTDKYSYNSNFFSNIDCEEKAYWLGFIYADGCISLNSENRNYELCIKLASKDKKHLHKFNKSINGNIPVVIKKVYKFNNQYEECAIRVYCKKMVEDLIDKNLLQNKSTLSAFPIVKKELFLCFLRGYFDGDGSVFVDKKKDVLKYQLVSSHRECLDYIREVLYNDYNISSYILFESKEKINEYNKLKKNGINCNFDKYTLCVAGMINGNNFGNLLYEKANIYLDRKYNLFHNHKINADIDNRIILYKNNKKK